MLFNTPGGRLALKAMIIFMIIGLVTIAYMAIDAYVQRNQSSSNMYIKFFKDENSGKDDYATAMVKWESGEVLNFIAKEVYQEDASFTGEYTWDQSGKYILLEVKSTDSSNAVIVNSDGKVIDSFTLKSGEVVTQISKFVFNANWDYDFEVATKNGKNYQYLRDTEGYITQEME